MASRKRRRVTEEEEEKEEVESKKANTVHWEWEGDDGKWIRYSNAHSQKLVDAMTRGAEELTLRVTPGVKMRVRFSLMTQSNVSTGWQRNVRCVVVSPTHHEQGVWERQDNDGAWLGFSESTSRQLQAAQTCAVEEVMVSVGGKKCSVDLRVMEWEGEEEGKRRPVRCVPPDTAVPSVWQWQDKVGVWRSCPPATSSTLEEVYCAGWRTATISVSGKSCSIDLWSMQQSGGDMTVRRIPAGDDKHTQREPGPARGAPSSSTSSSLIRSSGSSSRPVRSDPASESTVKTHQFIGKAAVDSECSRLEGKAHVFCEDEDVWTAMLNQTNLKNNNNKFYLIQLLEENKRRAYSVWFRWGRVGKRGQYNLQEFGSNLTAAKETFKQKFYDKTCNDWEERDSFVKVPGKYDLLSMEYGAEDETDLGGADEEEEEGKTQKRPQSQLDQRLQELIQLICNVKSMEETVKEMKYDTRKAPLGKLTTAQLKMGYAALKKIEQLIISKCKGDPLVKACDQFYTRIPHDFGMRTPPIISTIAEVKQKLSLLEALGDIQIAMSVLHRSSGTEHPIDTHYHELHCLLRPVEKEEDTFQLVERYVKNTHGRTHTQYWLEVKHLFAVEREGEAEQFVDVGNRQLLWHGSRLTNWVGILNQGLRIAPPEAPVTGYMFGKGLYFADVCSKSANYCFATPSKNEGLLLLCEVALGNQHELLAADYDADQLPVERHSVKGLGRMAPDSSLQQTLEDGCVVPLGRMLDTGVLNSRGYTLNYNEFVVYNSAQVKMRYLVHLKFHFK